MKKTIIIGLIGLLGLMGLMGEARGQAVATLASDTIALGDQTTLTVRNALTFPSTDLLSQNGVVALRQDFDTAARSQTTVITCFEPGEHYIKLSDEDSLLLVVTDVEIDSATAELRDIAPIERVPYTFWEVFRWVLLGLAVVAAAFGICWLLKHRKDIVETFHETSPKDTRTPEERALQTLEALRVERLWQSGRVKEYHTRLTDAVRQFIEESTGIRATDMTSDDCLNALMHDCLSTDATNTHAIKQSSIQALKDIFNTADMVKFAKSEPSPHEHERSMDEAVGFVGEMWQVVKPAENKEEVKNA